MNEEDPDDMLCVGSIEELESLSGEKVSDLHKHFMDRIIIRRNGKTYRRTPEVLDCWFESGSMPYARDHYPFENKDGFGDTFPADFIAEGLDQTRGMVLHVDGAFHRAFQPARVSKLHRERDGPGRRRAENEQASEKLSGPHAHY